MIYGEDIFVGYRYYEKISLPVLFPFGHGLSYTKFSLSSLTVQSSVDYVSISVNVENTGFVEGAEVVQVYVARDSTSVTRPVKELKGWTKVFLKPGEIQCANVKVPLKYATSFWDESKYSWCSEEGGYQILVGNSSEGELLTESFHIDSNSWWKGL
jgi:beta-glucosidase